MKSKKSGWTEFYNFLEDSARTAKEMLKNESINAALNAENEKPKCPSCNKSHSVKCNKTKNMQGKSAYPDIAEFMLPRSPLKC